MALDGLYSDVPMLGLSEWDWSLFDDVDVLGALRSYDFDEDPLLDDEPTGAQPVTLFSLLRGDIETASAGLDFDRALQNIAAQPQALKVESTRKTERHSPYAVPAQI